VTNERPPDYAVIAVALKGIERGQQLDDGHGIQSTTTASSTSAGSDLLPSNSGWNRTTAPLGTT